MEHIHSKIIIKKGTKKLSKFQLYLFYFFLFAFFGWLMETAYSFVMLGHFTKRGFLYGPLCPLYGYGALILILFLGNTEKFGEHQTITRNQGFILILCTLVYVLYTIYEEKKIKNEKIDEEIIKDVESKENC